MSKKPKILVWDIETSKQRFTTTGFFKAGKPIFPKAHEITSQKIHCIGYKWLGEKSAHVISVHDFKGNFKKDHMNDLKVVKEFQKVLKEADASIGHNLKNYDMGHLNARIMLNGLDPIIFPYPIDTLLLAKSNFNLRSNKLDEIASDLKLKVRKNPMTELDWDKCFAGEEAAFKKMAKYCKQDVFLTEAVYNELYKYCSNHPKISRIMGATLKESHKKCPVCNSSNNIKNGKYGSTTGVRQKRMCLDCGKKWIGEVIK